MVISVPWAGAISGSAATSQVKALAFDVLNFLPWEAQDFDPLSLARAGAPDAAETAVWDDASLPGACGSGNCACQQQRELATADSN